MITDDEWAAYGILIGCTIFFLTPLFAWIFAYKTGKLYKKIRKGMNRNDVRNSRVYPVRVIDNNVDNNYGSELAFFSESILDYQKEKFLDEDGDD